MPVSLIRKKDLNGFVLQLEEMACLFSVEVPFPRPLEGSLLAVVYGSKGDSLLERIMSQVPPKKPVSDSSNVDCGSLTMKIAGVVLFKIYQILFLKYFCPAQLPSCLIRDFDTNQKWQLSAASAVWQAQAPSARIEPKISARDKAVTDFCNRPIDLSIKVFIADDI